MACTSQALRPRKGRARIRKPKPKAGTLQCLTNPQLKRIVLFVRRITGNEDLAVQQLLEGKLLRNRLTALHNEHRRAGEDLLNLHHPELAPLKDEMIAAFKERDEHEAAIMEWRKANGKKRGAPKEVSKPFADAKRQAEAARRKYNAARKVAWTTTPGLRENQDAHKRARKGELAQLGGTNKLDWGTYNQINDNCLWRSYVDARFRPWDGSGFLRVQIQKGITCAKLLQEGCPQLRLERLSNRNEESPASNRSKRRQFYRGSIRLGSLDKKGKPKYRGHTPVWCEFECMGHRDMAQDWTVKEAWLHRSRTGLQHRWELHLVCSIPCASDPLDYAEVGNIGFDFGYRPVAEGLRVVTWSGDDGECGELIIPQKIMDYNEHLHKLYSDAKTLFNDTVAYLRNWLHSNPVPEWLTEATTHIHLWKKERKLGKLLSQWNNARFVGDEEIFAFLCGWLKPSRRLKNRAARVARRVQNWRNNRYRNFAADLARDYRLACIEDFSAKKFQVTESADKEDIAAKKTKRNMRLASPGALKQVLKQRFAEHVLVPCENTTKRCPVCLAVNKFGKKEKAAQFLTCKECGQTRDRDYGAAETIRRTGLELIRSASGDGVNETPAPARNPELPPGSNVA